MSSSPPSPHNGVIIGIVTRSPRPGGKKPGQSEEYHDRYQAQSKAAGEFGMRIDERGQPLVALASAFRLPDGNFNVDQYSRYLQHHRVPTHCIRIVYESLETIGEIRALARVQQEHGGRLVLIAVKNQMRRVRLICREIGLQDVEFIEVDGASSALERYAEPTLLVVTWCVFRLRKVGAEKLWVSCVTSWRRWRQRKFVTLTPTASVITPAPAEDTAPATSSAQSA